MAAATHDCIHARSTGQRLPCPDDPTCPYSTSDKSALLRHRQRKHGYQAKPTASKDRCMTVSKNLDRMNSSEKLDDPSDNDSSPGPHLEHVTESRCPRCCSSGQAYGANDETDIWQCDDHRASPPSRGTSIGVTKQTVESIERSLVEGHATSRFPVSFARTRLPHGGQENGASSLSTLKQCHCRCRRTSNLPPTPEIVAMAHSNGTRSNPISRTRTGVKVKELVIYKRVSYLVRK